VEVSEGESKVIALFKVQGYDLTGEERRFIYSLQWSDSQYSRVVTSLVCVEEVRPREVLTSILASVRRDSKSFAFTMVTCGIYQGSVLGPILFIM